MSPLFRFSACVLVAAAVAFLPIALDSTSQYPTVAQILRDGKPAASAPDAVVRGLDGRVRPGGISLRDPLSDERLTISTEETIVVEAPDGRDSLTLEPGSSAFFQRTATSESVYVDSGKVYDRDQLGFFSNVRSEGGIVLTAPYDPDFSIFVVPGTQTSPDKVTATASSGTITATLVSGNGGTERVDTLSSARQTTATYSVGDNRTVLVSSSPSSASTDDPATEFSLAESYFSPSSCEQSTISQAQAFDFLRRAAAAHYAPAAEELGRLYEQGYRVARDYASAARWLQRAAEQGDAQAEIGLATLYRTGTGVPRSYQIALKYYRAAASTGSSEAESSLGAMYETGEGVTHSTSTALYWYRLAASQGDGAAINALARSDATGLFRIQVQQILHNGNAVEVAEDVVLRQPNGNQRLGLRRGQILPPAIRIIIPARESVRLAVTTLQGQSSITLIEGADVSFGFNGYRWSVTVNAGEIEAHDPLDLFRVRGPEIDACAAG